MTAQENSVDSASKASFPARVRPLVRPGLLLGVMILIIFQGVGFQTQWLDQDKDTSRPVDAQRLLEGENTKVLATGIPSDRAPDYSIQQFSFVSTQSGRKEWKVVADQAFLFKKQEITHLKSVRAWIYNARGEATEVTATEGKQSSESRTIELFGNVNTRLPNGFRILSDYLIHRPDEKTVSIPYPWPVTGDGSEMEVASKKGTDKNQGTDLTLYFSSLGANVDSNAGRMYLLAGSVVTLDRRDAQKPDRSFLERRNLPQDRQAQGIPDRTVIASDRATVISGQSEAIFSMSEKTPSARRFVRILQPKTYARGRTATVQFGNQNKQLHWIAIDQDILIKEREPTEDELALRSGKIDGSREKKALQYATAGRAEFDANSDNITLKVFPQAYQDESTLTGDWMIIHRESDLVEVLHGNAYSTGQK